jgi:putative intracellular protease/amidase
MASRVVTLVFLTVIFAPLAQAAAGSPHTGHPATCAQQSGASFPRAFTSPDNLVAGPLSLIGAGRVTSAATVHEFGGNKFPALVRAGHTVTVALSARAHRSASLFYAIGSGGAPTERRVRDGRRAITFRSCSARRAASDADGDPVTFWSGFVVVAKPMCVRLQVWIDAEPTPRRARIALGRRC